jgi:PGF-CTERM protein
MEEGVSRRTALSVLGGTMLPVGVASSSSAREGRTDQAPVSTEWALQHSGSRPSRTNDVVVTDAGAYLAGTSGSIDNMYARVLRTTPATDGKPSVEADDEFFGALPVHERVETMVERPDGRFDLVARNEDGRSTLHRYTDDGNIDNAHAFDEDQSMRIGVAAPRSDGSTLVVGTDDSGGTAGAIVADDAQLSSHVRHDVGGTCQAGVPRDDGGCLAVGARGDEIQVVRVDPDATVDARGSLDVPGEPWRGVAHGDGAVFGGRYSGDFTRGLVFALESDGQKRWHTTLAVDTAVKDVAPIGDGGVLAVGAHVPDNRPWIARLTGDGRVAWEGTLSGDHRGQLRGVHVDDGGTIVAAGTVLGEEHTEMLLVGLQVTGDASTPTAADTATSTSTPTDTPTPSPPPTDTATPTSTPPDDTPGSDEESPTETSGPGMGAVAGVAGLLGGALVWRRRAGDDE